MLEVILNHLHNDFAVQGAGLSGVFTISSGTISLPSVQPGQYFWIRGSVFNDGLHKAPAEGLTNETFTGRIVPAAIPKALLDLSEEIKIWVDKNPATDLTSESFGGYSYSRASDQNGTPITWQGVFRSQLNRWRKLS